VDEYARTADERGLVCVIAGAGMANHLAGAVAARTAVPVIGVPLSGSKLSGVDALYSTVQMPKGVPVATVAIDGAVNAAILAAQILAVRNEDVKRRVWEFKDSLAEGFRP
jgi:5-(carboxyamino)imidazole ribonucleotide mutase